MEGMTEAACILVIEHTWNYLKHFLLVEGNLSAFADERAKLFHSYVNSKRISY